MTFSHAIQYFYIKLHNNIFVIVIDMLDNNSILLTRVDLMVSELNDKSINGGLNEINALGEGHFIRFHRTRNT